MQDKDTTPSTFSQVFQPILSKNIWSKIHQEIPNADKGIKKLTSQKLVLLIANAQIQEYSALREISASVKNDDMSEAIQLESISHSTVSRRLRDLNPKVPEILFRSVTHQIALRKGYKVVTQKLGRLNLIDSSTMGLCFSRYRWAEFRRTKAGVKLHLGLNFDGIAHPIQSVITPAKTADRKLMEELIVEDPDAINVFDRGYNDYTKYDEFCEKGIRFVTRLKDNAVYEFTGVARPVKQVGPIEDDVDIILGSQTKRMRNPLRAITVYDEDKNPITLLTNVFDRSAEELSDIYRHRWQIELFFKWLKQHAQIKHFFGLSKTAVINQLLIALLTYCLLLLLKLDLRYGGDLLSIKRLLTSCLFESYQDFIRKLLSKSGKSSRGRKRLRNATIFVATYLQVLSGKTEFLNSLTYDPLIL